MGIENGSLLSFKKINKEKTDTDENKSEREVWEDKSSGLLALGAGEEMKFLQSGGQQFICLLIQSFLPSLLQNTDQVHKYNDELEADSLYKEFII